MTENKLEFYSKDYKRDTRVTEKRLSTTTSQSDLSANRTLSDNSYSARDHTVNSSSSERRSHRLDQSPGRSNRRYNERSRSRSKRERSRSRSVEHRRVRYRSRSPDKRRDYERHKYDSFNNRQSRSPSNRRNYSPNSRRGHSPEYRPRKESLNSRDNYQDKTNSKNRFEEQKTFYPPKSLNPYSNEKDISVSDQLNHLDDISLNTSIQFEEYPARSLNCWDVPPPGFSKLSAEQVKSTGLFPPPWAVVGKQQFQGMIDPTRIAMTMLKYPLQATKESSDLFNCLKRISFSNYSSSQFAYFVFITGLPKTGVSEQELIETFDQKLQQSNLLQQGESCVHSIYHSQTCAFIEVRTSEQFQFILSHPLSFEYNGNRLTLQRGKDFVAHYYPSLTDSRLRFERAPVGKPGEILVANLPKYLFEDELHELLSCFGLPKCVNLQKWDESPESPLKDWLTVEYEDEETTSIALEGLNLIEIGQHKLFAMESTAVNLNPFSCPSFHPLSGETGNDFVVTGDISNIIELHNLLNDEEFSNENIYSNTLDQIALECQQYGHILTIYAPRLDCGFGEPESSILGMCNRVFVVFSDTSSAVKAASGIAGRMFGEDRSVYVSFVPLKKFYSMQA